MRLVITEKADRRNTKEIEVTVAEIVLEDMRLLYIKKEEPNVIEIANLKTNFNYTISHK
jgi:hypothetical protein